MIRFREAEGNADRPVERAGNERLLLLFGAEIAEHQHCREIADDRAFILQIVVKAEALGREMFADHGHAEIGAALTAIFLRQCITQMARLVGEFAHLAEQFFPLMARQALIVPIGAGMLATVVEKALIIVLRLKRLDFLFNEIVEHREVVGELLGDREIHA